jgi:hypothetical protein
MRNCVAIVARLCCSPIMPAKKTLRAVVERLEKSAVVLVIGSREVTFPRSALPTPLTEGDVLAFTITRDGDGAAREEAAAELDSETGKRGPGRKRGNPRTASARTNKK